MESAQLELLLEVWKVNIQVQQHFNELALKVRQLALSLLAALLAAAAASQESSSVFKVLEFKTSLSAALLFTGMVVWITFFLVDRFWYYPLLQGAVKHAEQLEQALSPDLPGVALTSSISAASPVRILGRQLHSRHKMILFYASILILLALLAFAAHASASIDTSP